MHASGSMRRSRLSICRFVALYVHLPTFFAGDVEGVSVLCLTSVHFLHIRQVPICTQSKTQVCGTEVSFSANVGSSSYQRTLSSRKSLMRSEHGRVNGVMAREETRPSTFKKVHSKTRVALKVSLRAETRGLCCGENGLHRDLVPRSGLIAACLL